MAFLKVNEHNKYVVGTAAADKQMHGAFTREQLWRPGATGLRDRKPFETVPPLTINVTREHILLSTFKLHFHNGTCAISLLTKR